MSRILISAVLCLTVFMGFAQKPKEVTPKEVVTNLGDTVLVHCMIVDIAFQPNDPGKPTFLDQNHSWRQNPFMIVIFDEDRKNGFPTVLETYVSKKVEITGLVENHKIQSAKYNTTYERIGIRLRSSDQIKIIE
jgi:hypothetical protein